MTVSRDWCVYETVVADGSWSIGIHQGRPDASEAIVIADGLGHQEAVERAKQAAREYEAAGRPMGAGIARQPPFAPGDNGTHDGETNENGPES